MARTPPASGHCGGGRRAGDRFLKAFFPRRQWNGVSLGVRGPLSLVLGSGGQALSSTTNAQALYLPSSQRYILNHVRLVLAGLARGGQPRGRLPGGDSTRGLGAAPGPSRGACPRSGETFPPSWPRLFSQAGMRIKQSHKVQGPCCAVWNQGWAVQTWLGVAAAELVRPGQHSLSSLTPGPRARLRGQAL